MPGWLVVKDWFALEVIWRERVEKFLGLFLSTKEAVKEGSALDERGMEEGEEGDRKGRALEGDG